MAVTVFPKPSGWAAGATDIPFDIATTDWTAITGGYKAEVTDPSIAATSIELVTYTDSIEQLNGNITKTKDAANHKLVFFVTSLPSGTISGNICCIDSLSTSISNGEKGVANGVATLDANGKVASSQMPFSVSNSLTDTSTTNALSAAKGKELNDLIVTYHSSETITDCNTYRKGIGRIVDSTANRPFNYGILNTYIHSNTGYMTQSAISISTAPKFAYRSSTDGGTNWQAWYNVTEHIDTLDGVVNTSDDKAETYNKGRAWNANSLTVKFPNGGNKGQYRTYSLKVTAANNVGYALYIVGTQNSTAPYHIKAWQAGFSDLPGEPVTGFAYNSSGNSLVLTFGSTYYWYVNLSEFTVY